MSGENFLENSKNSVVLKRKNCNQLFLVFTGWGRGANSSNFFKEAGITDRNIIMFKEPGKKCHGYLKGIDKKINSIHKLCQKIQCFISRNPHIKDVYCIGNSSGASGSLLVGNKIKAKTSWGFSLGFDSVLKFCHHESSYRSLRYISISKELGINTSNLVLINDKNTPSEVKVAKIFDTKTNVCIKLVDSNTPHQALNHYETTGQLKELLPKFRKAS